MPCISRERLREVCNTVGQSPFVHRLPLQSPGSLPGSVCLHPVCSGWPGDTRQRFLTRKMCSIRKIVLALRLRLRPLASHPTSILYRRFWHRSPYSTLAMLVPQTSFSIFCSVWPAISSAWRRPFWGKEGGCADFQGLQTRPRPNSLPSEGTFHRPASATARPSARSTAPTEGPHYTPGDDASRDWDRRNHNYL